MFALLESPLEEIDFRQKLTNPQSGAYASFEGWVRDHNEGKQVRFLEYEAYSQLAESQARSIMVEAREKFEILEIQCVHRVGRLAIGEMAVYVGVSAAHRDAAFKACRYLIDQIKYRLPIWKKEHYIDGDSGWVNCEACSAGHTHHR
jgi:molybdopterin synthase catalytic subunit